MSLLSALQEGWVIIYQNEGTQTLMRKALSQKYFLKSLISVSNKCSAVWLNVRVSVSEEWTYCRKASSLSCTREKPGERFSWKLKHHKSKPNGSFRDTHPQDLTTLSATDITNQTGKTAPESHLADDKCIRSCKQILIKQLSFSTWRCQLKSHSHILCTLKIYLTNETTDFHT